MSRKKDDEEPETVNLEAVLGGAVEDEEIIDTAQLEPEETEEAAETTEEAVEEPETKVESGVQALSDEELNAELARRRPSVQPEVTDFTEDTGFDLQTEVRATQRATLIQGILSDVKAKTPDLPASYLNHWEDELVNGVIVDGKRKPFTVEELSSMKRGLD